MRLLVRGRPGVPMVAPERSLRHVHLLAAVGRNAVGRSRVHPRPARAVALR